MMIFIDDNHNLNNKKHKNVFIDYVMQYYK